MSVKHEVTAVKQAVFALCAKAERGPISEAVDAGAALHEAHVLLRRTIEALKDRLRFEVRSTPDQRVLTGDEAIATVSTPEPILRLARGTDTTALRRVLGDSFDSIFQIAPRPEALPRILELPEEVQQAVFAVIKQDMGSGGVTFSRRKQG